jgi:hypothetical protein
MRKAICAAALILALTCSAHGGWMPNGQEEPPPPPPVNTTEQSASTEDDAVGATDTLTQIVLTVLVSVLH